MSKYKKKPRSHGEVELNMAAMLDMAFQLLAFFILTFRPSAVEAQVSLRMPPAKITSDGAAGTQLDMKPDQEEDLGNQLSMSVIATPDGEIARITIGGQELDAENKPVDQVTASLNSLLGPKIRDGKFDAIALQASQNLLYERLMQVVDVCTRQTLDDGQQLTKISISDIPAQ
jgi:biopolymer transport protein ExbD